MFGLDHALSHLGSGGTLLVVIAVSALLGLRHATDPDHLVAVSTLVAADPHDGRARAARVGLFWGLGHATTLSAIGLVLIVMKAAVPETVCEFAEVMIGVIIIALALRLILRWRSGRSHCTQRTSLQGYAIGAVHGIGGSAGATILLFALIRDEAQAVASLLIFSVCTALSMSLISGVLGVALSGQRASCWIDRVIPVLGAVSLVFGTWYLSGALELVPYYF